MIQLILEQPLMVLIFTVILTLILLWGWLQSTKKEVLLMAGLCLLIGLALTAIGYAVETDREALVSWLDETAAELEKNQFDALRAKIHPAADQGIRDLASHAESLRINRARIAKIFDTRFSGNPPDEKAIVEMNVNVDVEFNGNQKIPRYVELTLYKVNGEWLVYGVRHEEPTYGFRVHTEEP